MSDFRTLEAELARIEAERREAIVAAAEGVDLDGIKDRLAELDAELKGLTAQESELDATKMELKRERRMLHDHILANSAVIEAGRVVQAGAADADAGAGTAKRGS